MLPLPATPVGSPPPRSAGWVTATNLDTGIPMYWHSSKGPLHVLPSGEAPSENAATPTPSPPLTPREGPLLSARVRPRQESITCGVIATSVVPGSPASTASESSSSSLQIEGYSPRDYPPSPPTWPPESPPASRIRTSTKFEQANSIPHTLTDRAVLRLHERQYLHGDVNDDRARPDGQFTPGPEGFVVWSSDSQLASVQQPSDSDDSSASSRHSSDEHDESSPTVTFDPSDPTTPVTARSTSIPTAPKKTCAISRTLYSEVLAAGLHSTAPSFPPVFSSKKRAWTTTKPKARDMGRRHVNDGVAVFESEVRGSRAAPQQFLKSAKDTVSLWGAGRVGPDTLMRRVRLHLKDHSELGIRNVVRVHQESGDVRYDVTFFSETDSKTAFPILASAGPTTGGWLARTWSNYHARHHVKATMSVKKTGSTQSPRLPRDCSAVRELTAITLNTASLVSSRTRVSRLLALHSASIVALQEVFHSTALVPTPKELHNLAFPGYHTFHGKFDPEVAGSHGIMLAFKKPSEVWEYGAPSHYHVAAVLDSGHSLTLFMSVYVPVVATVHLRTARKKALSAIFATVGIFLRKHPAGKVCLMGDWNMTPTILRKHLDKSDLDLNVVPLAGGLDDDPSSFSFYRQHYHPSTGQTSTLATRVDYVVVRQDQVVSDLAIDHTYAGSDHFPLVCTVGTALESPYSEPKKTFKANRQALMKPGPKQRKVILNHFRLLAAELNLDVCDNSGETVTTTVPSDSNYADDPAFSGSPPAPDLDPIDVEQVASPTSLQPSPSPSDYGCPDDPSSAAPQEEDRVDDLAADSDADLPWRPNLDHDPCSSPGTRASLDDTCALLFDAATSAMIQSGTGAVVPDQLTYTSKRRISKKAIKLLNLEKKTQARLRRATQRLQFSQSENRVRKHALRTREARLARDEASTLLKDERQASWRKFIRDGCGALTKGGEHGRGDPAKHWSFVKRVIGGRAGGAGTGDVLLPDGSVASGDAKVLDAWSQHLKTLFSDSANGASRGCADMWDHEFARDDRGLIRDPIPASATPLTWIEICQAAHKMKRGKAPGSSGIPLEFWTAFIPSKRDLLLHRQRHGREVPMVPDNPVSTVLWSVICKIVETGHIPSNMTEIVSVWLHKKGDRRDPGNYRGIALIEPLLKLITTAFATRTQRLLEHQDFYRVEQGGFRTAEETGSQIATLWEVCLRRKVCGLRTYLFFSDLKKAFDTVGHQALLRKLYSAGIRGDSLRFFTALYRSPRIAARLACGKTSMIDYLRGVLQGCPASPTAFITYINDAFDALEQQGGGVGVPGMRLDADDADNGVLEYFLGLLFADDAVATASNIDQMKRVLMIVESWAQAWDLQFGIPKCGLMVVSPKDTEQCDKNPKGQWSVHMQELLDAKLTLADEIVPVVEAYEYLGFLYHYDLDLKPGVQARAAAVRKRRVLLRKFLGSSSIPLGCRVIILNAMLAPVATYAGELLGMCTTDSGCALVKPIVREFNRAVELVIRGSWNVRESSRNSFPMGTVRAPAYDQYGIRDIEAVYAQLRARAYAKWPSLQTWIKHLAAKPLDFNIKYTVLEPDGTSNDVTIKKNSTKSLWFTKTAKELGDLQKWSEDTAQRQIALACYVNPWVTDSPDTAQAPLTCKTHMTRGNAKAFSHRVFHTAAARLRARSLSIGKLSKASNLYFKTRNLHLSSHFMRRMSIKNLGHERGYHWLARARCNAFIHTMQAVAAKIIMPPQPTDTQCAICKKRKAKDSLTHFLLHCNPRVRGTTDPSELSQLRTLNKLKEVATTIGRISQQHLSLPATPLTDDHLVAILLGGEVGDISTLYILDMKYDTIQVSDLELLSEAYGNDSWKKLPLPLCAVAMHSTAKFLQTAMPIRNDSLWKHLTPRMKKVKRTSLGQSHGAG